MTKKDYYDFLKEFASFFEEIEAFELLKLDVILSKDIERIQKLIKDQEINDMKIKSMEQKRIRLQKEVGLGQLKFSEILIQCEENERNGLSATFKRIEDAISNVQFYNRKTQKALHENEVRAGITHQDQFGYSKEEILKGR